MFGGLSKTFPGAAESLRGVINEEESLQMELGESPGNAFVLSGRLGCLKYNLYTFFISLHR